MQTVLKILCLKGQFGFSEMGLHEPAVDKELMLNCEEKLLILTMESGGFGKG